jgi:hypothetical protein
MRKALFTLVILASAFTLPLTAHADAIDQFTFNFVTPPGYVSANLTIDLPASPPPSFWTDPGFGCDPVDCFAVVGESGSTSYLFDFYQSAPDSTEFIRFTVFNPLFGPPSAVRGWALIFAAEDVFTGSVSDPTFLTGIFDAMYRPFATSPTFPGSITIEPIDTTVPEPSSLILLTTGALFLIAFVATRKRAHYIYN